jgi:N-acetylmuramoyl-L-alanine amidase
MFKIEGKCSWFGGPDDTGVSPSEGLAFIYEIDDAPHLFLAEQPEGTTGLARRLDPEKFYVACRWDYDVTSKDDLLKLRVIVHSPKTGKAFVAHPADWGPHEDTDRHADISPGLMAALGISTDDMVQVIVPHPGEAGVDATTGKTVAISVGHGLHIRGAKGPTPWGLDEVNEACKVTDAVAAAIRRRKGWQAITFFDQVSDNQDDNLMVITDFHNAVKPAEHLNVMVHFNAYDETTGPMGVEVCYVTQHDLAVRVSGAIATAGDFTDRGAKYRDGLYVLNNTEAPAILLEVCFVDSKADADNYRRYFEAITEAIAEAITGGSLTV